MAEEHKLPAGKLPPEALKRSVLSYVGARRPEVLIGPGVGEDASVIRWPDGKYLVFSSDPIVGADKGAGRLLVRINSNDIASKGGDPAYLAVTLVLPPALGEEGARRIMSEIDEECRAQGIAVAGGHTEFNDRYDRPVIMGALIGTADKVMRATIRRDTVTVSFMLANTELDRFLRQEGIKKVKIAPVAIRLESDDDLKLAKQTADLTMEHILEEQQYRKERRNELRRQSRMSKEAEKQEPETQSE